MKISVKHCNFCACLYVLLSQERQRLETILSLCSELGRAEKDEGDMATNPTSAVADLQKINQELEKLQLNDDDDDDTPSVFSDSLAAIETLGNGHITSPGSENGYYDGDILVRQRHRDNGALSPTISLQRYPPSSSPRMHSANEVEEMACLFQRLLQCTCVICVNPNTFLLIALKCLVD